MAKLTDMIPEEGATKWVQPDPDNFPEVEFCIASVDARKLDVISRRCKVTITHRNEKGKIETKEEFSNVKAARVYSEEAFMAFKGIEDDKGKEMENTVENRAKILSLSNSFLNFVVDYAHSESNFLAKKKAEVEKDFLTDSESSSKSTSDRTPAR